MASLRLWSLKMTDSEMEIRALEIERDTALARVRELSSENKRLKLALAEMVLQQVDREC